MALIGAYLYSRRLTRLRREGWWRYPACGPQRQGLYPGPAGASRMGSGPSAQGVI